MSERLNLVESEIPNSREFTFSKVTLCDGQFGRSFFSPFHNFQNQLKMDREHCYFLDENLEDIDDRLHMQQQRCIQQGAFVS